MVESTSVASQPVAGPLHLVGLDQCSRATGLSLAALRVLRVHSSRRSDVRIRPHQFRACADCGAAAAVCRQGRWRHAQVAQVGKGTCVAHAVLVQRAAGRLPGSDHALSQGRRRQGDQGAALVDGSRAKEPVHATHLRSNE